MSETKRISQKEIQPALDAIALLVASIRKEVENMPKCSKKESLLLTIVAFEKKIAIAVKELTEATVMEYVNKHPEVLQKLAHFAATDKGAVEVAQEATSETDTNEQQTEKQKPKRKH